MQVRTTIRERVPPRRKFKTKQNKFMFFILLLCESVINTFMPFIAGFYLATTQSLLWFFPFIVLLVFNLRIEYFKDSKIEITFVRRL